MNLKPHHEEILRNRVAWKDNKTLIISGELSRKDYTEINDILESVGGVWDKKQKAHIWQSESAPDALLQVINAGQYVNKAKDFELYGTPLELARWMYVVAGIFGNAKGPLLEPNIGRGGIALHCPSPNMRIIGFDLDPDNVAYMNAKGFQYVKEANFLDVAPKPVFEYVLMNPPFSGKADVAHFKHALKFLSDTGSIVAIMSSGFATNSDAETTKVRDYIQKFGGSITVLEGSPFKESGTDVSVCLVYWNKSFAKQGLKSLIPVHTRFTSKAPRMLKESLKPESFTVKESWEKYKQLSAEAVVLEHKLEKTMEGLLGEKPAAKPTTVYDKMLDSLYAALPFVEDAKDNACYKPASVAQVEKKIKESIRLAQAATITTVRDIADRMGMDYVSGLFVTSLTKGQTFKLNSKSYEATLNNDSKVRIKREDGVTLEAKRFGSKLAGNEKYNNFVRDIEGQISVDLINENNKFHTKSDVFIVVEKAIANLPIETRSEEFSKLSGGDTKPKYKLTKIKTGHPLGHFIFEIRDLTGKLRAKTISTEEDATAMAEAIT